MKKNLLIVMLLVCAPAWGGQERNVLSCGCPTDRDLIVPIKPGPWRKAIPIPTGLVTVCMHLSPVSPWMLTESRIIDQEYDLMLWKQLSVSHFHLQGSAILNPVQSGAYSSQEYVMIAGKLAKPSGGESGVTSTPAFRLTVPSVDVDWESYSDKIKDEPGEDGRLVYLPVTTDVTQHRMIAVKTPRDDFSKVHPIMTLSWTPADKAKLWRTDGTAFVNGGEIDVRKIVKDEGGFPLHLRVEPLSPCAELKITLKGEKDDFLREKAEDSVKACLFKIEVTNIKFNHDTAASTEDAINLRKDYSTPYNVSNGEWVKGGQNLPVCYIKSKSVKVMAKFSVQPATVFGALIWAEPVTGNGSLNMLLSKPVSFNGGVSAYETFQMDGLTPHSIQCTTNIWQWKVKNVNAEPSLSISINTSGVHKVYAILQEPQVPWINQWQNSKNLWSVVLDKTCTDVWAGGCTDEQGALAKITYAAYHSYGKTYDGTRSHFTGTFCHLSDLMNDNSVDCHDMSAIVHLFGRAVGCANVFVQRETQPFQTKDIKLVGPGQIWLSSTFLVHQFAVMDFNVYDACVQLKSGALPYLPINDPPLNYHENIYAAGGWVLSGRFECTDFD